MEMKMSYKKLLLLSLFCGIIFMSNTHNVSQDKDNKEEEKVITVDKLIHDFGTIKEEAGEVSTEFIITNNTDSTIAISKVIVSCGCSNTKWTKEPIAPGKTGKVTVLFDPKGFYGPFEKSATVATTGNPNKILLRIKGIVE
ncbi:MAG: DUF1573 domain-containing protein [Dysgonamonadaceae bacterium]|nr:DUF1573 domain-containing protein [Dysgonamonadaceae bacterium]